MRSAQERFRKARDHVKDSLWLIEAYALSAVEGAHDMRNVMSGSRGPLNSLNRSDDHLLICRILSVIVQNVQYQQSLPESTDN
jgi:hypothetical protein